MAGKPPRPENSLRARQRDFARAQFLEIGLQLLFERGYAHTTIEELAERCGCAKGTIYSHFPDGKDDLYRAIYRDVGDQFAEAFQTALDDEQQSLAGLAIRAAEILIEISEDSARGRFFMVDAPALPGVLQDELGRTSRGLIDTFAKRLQSAQRAGEIDADADPVALSCLLVGMLRESSIRVAAGVVSAEQMRAAVHHALPGFLAGLSRTGGTV